MNALRRDAARDLLASKKSVTETAFLLGYQQAVELELPRTANLKKVCVCLEAVFSKPS